MSNLNEQQMAHLNDLLHRREQELRQEVNQEIGDRDDYLEMATEAPDPGDSSFADLTVDLENAGANRDIAELRAIERAYAHIEQGTYGECIDCGMDIPYERLEAQPTAERCAPCQDNYEKHHIDQVRRNSL
jgi:RNA polymerase-binding protein DksA